MTPTAILTIGAPVLGLGLWYHSKSKTLPAVPSAGTSYDPGMDSLTAKVVARALQIETDTSLLDTLATDLKNAGFPNSAAAVAQRSNAVRAQIGK
ncbi:MAG: hypothetical protein ACYCPT_01990 [Acidimicrobiales bacterium]